ncbi:MAG: PEGA domain-containing protein [Myxococcaceae bacterium]
MATTRVNGWKAAALSLFVVSPAFAQGFELDLTEQKPQVPEEFRPTIAVIGVTAIDETNDLATVGRAKLLESELDRVVAAMTGDFTKIVSPSDAAKALEGGADAARKCIDFSCLDANAKKIKVDRLILATIAKSGPGHIIKVYGFDGALSEVVQTEFESGEKQEKAAMGGFAGLQGKSQATKDKELIKKATPIFQAVANKLVTGNGKISIDTAEPSAVSTLSGGIEGGTGSFTKVVPRGAYDVKVNAEGYQQFEAHVTVEPMKQADVHVVLIAKPVEVKAVPIVREETTPVIQRPGAYIAVAGVACVVVGLVLGSQAKSIEGKAVDANMDGRLDITRAQAKSAQGDALAANVLVGVGAAAIAGGAIWFFAVPGKVKHVDEATGGEGAGSSGGGFGITMGVGGRF